METQASLQQYLAEWSVDSSERAAIADTLLALADASIRVGKIMARGPVAGSLAEIVGNNTDGDAQKKLDVVADRIFIEALGNAPVAVVGSEENETALLLDGSARLAVAIDPLDGSSNIETNMSVGTIFSILPVEGNSGEVIEEAILQPGRRQVAAGFIIYGPQTILVLTVCSGVVTFTLDPDLSKYVSTASDISVPADKKEYAINASNYCFWHAAVRAYIDDCVCEHTKSGEDKFNMRWVASLVAEAYRILVRGGIFLYPEDDRPGYQNGRLRLVYEANPIALLIEQAGGKATDGMRNILDIEPDNLHQRIPLVFGSARAVERVSDYYGDRKSRISRAPLFAQRGLFRD